MVPAARLAWQCVHQPLIIAVRDPAFRCGVKQNSSPRKSHRTIGVDTFLDSTVLLSVTLVHHFVSLSVLRLIFTPTLSPRFVSLFSSSSLLVSLFFSIFSLYYQPTSSLVHPLPGRASLLPRLILSPNEYQKMDRFPLCAASSCPFVALLSRNRAIFRRIHASRQKRNIRTIHCLRTIVILRRRRGFFQIAIGGESIYSRWNVRRFSTITLRYRDSFFDK